MDLPGKLELHVMPEDISGVLDGSPSRCFKLGFQPKHINFPEYVWQTLPGLFCKQGLSKGSLCEESIDLLGHRL